MKICLVTPDISGFVFNGGVGTATVSLARLLVKDGHSVDILFSNRQTHHDPAFVWWQSKFLEEGITLRSVKNPSFVIAHGHEYVRLSYAVYEDLRDSSYDRIIFSEMSGCGYYCLRAKETGLEFQKTDLWVIFHGPGLWHLRYNEALPTQLQQLTTHYMETESVFLAEKVLFATKHSRDQAKRMWGRLPQDHEVILFPFEKARPAKRFSKCEELIFFGRIETRKGIDDFLSALILLKDHLRKNRIRPVLLGHLGLIKGESARPKLEKWQKDHGILLEIVDDKNSDEAWVEIQKRKGLLILASHEETMGYTFVECLQKGAPFIYSSIDAFKELSEALTENGAPSFHPRDPEGLARAMKGALKTHARIRMKTTAHAELCRKWSKLMAQASKLPFRVLPMKVTFSVCIPHYERFNFLVYALESVMAERTLISEIIIYDDGSKDCLGKLKKLEKSWSGVPLRIIYGQRNKGVSFARNAMAKVAIGSHLIYLDDDNQLNHQAIRDYKKTILTTRCDIVVSSLERVKLENDSNAPTAIWPPLGPELSTNIFHNVIGDANCCVRRETVLALGGFNEELKGREDQEFFLRAHLKGYKFAIVPRPLVFYGIHEGNAHMKVNDEANRRQFFQSVEKHLSPGLTPLWELTQAWIYSQPQTSVWEWTHGPVSANRSDWDLWPKFQKPKVSLMKRIFENDLREFEKGILLELAPKKLTEKKLALRSDLKVKLIIWLPETTKFSTGQTEVTLPFGRSEIVIGLRKQQKLKLSTVSGAKKILISDIKVLNA